MLDLTKQPPTELLIGSVRYKINSDFRTGLKLCRLLADEDVDDMLKPFFALRLYFPEIPDDIDSALDGIMWFFRCGEQQGGSGEACFDYDADGEYIYAAFLQQYNIDLLTERLHWWKFQALLASLDDSCLFSKIIGWRKCEITSDMSDRQRAFLYSMKRYYSLRDKSGSDELENVLLNGGSCGGINVPPAE